MSGMRIGRLVSVPAIFILVLFCKVPVKPPDNTFPSEFRTVLKDVYLTSFKELKSDTITEYWIIFSYSISDCSSCIEAGFNLLENFDRSNKFKSCVITSSESYEIDKGRFGFSGSFIFDANGELRRLVSYSPTPAIIVLNSEMKIEDYLILTISNVPEIITYLESKSLITD